MDKNALAEKMATKKYMASGYFGDKAYVAGGKIAGIKYFDHKKAVEESLQEIDHMSKEELAKLEKELG